MQAKGIDTTARIGRTIELTDGPLIDDGYSSARRKFRVKAAIITYTLVDGSWEVPSWSNVELVGVAIKKDGTDSKVGVSRRPAFTWPRDEKIHPWLTEIVNAFRPVGEVDLEKGALGIQLGDGEVTP